MVPEKISFRQKNTYLKWIVLNSLLVFAHVIFKINVKKYISYTNLISNCLLQIVYHQEVCFSVLQWNFETETIFFRTLFFDMILITWNQIEVSTTKPVLIVWTHMYVILAPNFSIDLRQQKSITWSLSSWGLLSFLISLMILIDLKFVK